MTPVLKHEKVKESWKLGKCPPGEMYSHLLRNHSLLISSELGKDIVPSYTKKRGIKLRVKGVFLFLILLFERKGECEGNRETDREKEQEESNIWLYMILFLAFLNTPSFTTNNFSWPLNPTFCRLILTRPFTLELAVAPLNTFRYNPLCSPQDVNTNIYIYIYIRVWLYKYICVCAYIYIYIYCHPQKDCFVVPQLFNVARHIGRLKLGSKPAQLYVRLSIIPLSQQMYHVSSRIIRYQIVAFVCLHFIPSGSRKFYASDSHKFLRLSAQPP